MSFDYNALRSFITLISKDLRQLNDILCILNLENPKIHHTESERPLACVSETRSLLVSKRSEID